MNSLHQTSYRVIDFHWLKPFGSKVLHYFPTLRRTTTKRTVGRFRSACTASAGWWSHRIEIEPMWDDNFPNRKANNQCKKCQAWLARQNPR